MITDKKLVLVAAILAILSLIFLFFLPSEQEFEIIEAKILSSSQQKDFVMLNFYSCSYNTGLYDSMLESGDYQLLVTPAGRNFYYIEGFLKSNGSNSS